VLHRVVLVTQGDGGVEGWGLHVRVGVYLVEQRDVTKCNGAGSACKAPGGTAGREG
jgi:hypothetical protein